MPGNILVQSKQLLFFFRLIHWKDIILVKRTVSILLLFREDGGRFPMLICRRYNFNRSIWLLCKLHKQLCGSGFRSASGWAMWAAFDVSALLFLLPSVLFWLSFELPKYAALLCRFPGTVSFIGTDKDCCFARTNGSILTVVLCVTLADSCFRQVFFFQKSS